ncbi:MAG TPA: hypothetical protein DD727_03180, partial [Clostridiales bacterium]|nr:hypothetical protein [Clostridiales bacterium]
MAALVRIRRFSSFHAGLDTPAFRTIIISYVCRRAAIWYNFFAHPGGCEIGPRPIDLHIKALRLMGASISDTQYGVITCEAGRLKGCEIHLDYPSVGATENIMLCSIFALGDTVIRNAAREPEIVDLQSYLVKAGARIRGAGSEEIRIEGLGPGARLSDVEYSVMPDRIVAGTFLTAVAATGGRLCLDGVVPEHMSSIFSVLKESGCELTVRKDRVDLRAPPRTRAVDMIRTLPYPGFPTDMQPQMM